jgi:type II secretory pathway predicted ATPase ExeA
MPIDIDLPEVPGDPAGMRALAASLRSDAASAALVAVDVARRFDGLQFYGPAADRIGSDVSSSSRASGDVADQLLVTAGLLERSASEVEAAQRLRERKLEELRRLAAPTVP